MEKDSPQVSSFTPPPSTPVSGLNPHPSDDVLIRVENVSKKFCRSLKKSLWYGMKDLGSEWIDRNRAGKTTLLRMVNSLIKPDKGRIEMQGRLGAFIALGEFKKSLRNQGERWYTH